MEILCSVSDFLHTVMAPEVDFWGLLYQNDATRTNTKKCLDESFSFKNSFKLKEMVKKIRIESSPDKVLKCQRKEETCVCEFCGFKTISKSHLTRHMKKKHDTAPSKPRLTCDRCDYSSLNHAHIKRHEIAKHGGERFKCDSCDLTFSIKDSVARHKDIIHRNILYPCPGCDFVAKRTDSLKNHTQLKHSKLTFTCKLCGLKLKTKLQLRHHTDTDHRGIREHCKMCDFKAKDKSSVIRHMKGDHLNLRYSCSFCHLDYSHITSLKIHISEKHQGMNPDKGITLLEKKMKFSCEDCNFRAPSKIKLNRHNQTKHDVDGPKSAVKRTNTQRN